MKSQLPALLLLILPVNLPAVEPVDIGMRRELFVDPDLIDHLDGVRLVLHRPQPREVAIRFDRPWESSSPGYTTVIDDDGLYRMYYRATHTPPRFGEKNSTPRREVTCYAQSKDGIQQLKRIGTAITDTMFMASRDGVRFHVWPEAFVRPGIGRPGNWFYGDAGVALGIIETESSFGDEAPNELSFYVRENGRIAASGQLRRYTLRLDGFVSANASLQGGTLLTKPITFRGNQLQINYSTSAGGSLRIELQHPI